MKLKYNLHPLELWVTLVNMLLFHLEWSLPILTPSRDDNDRIWSVLGIALYDLLFAEMLVTKFLLFYNYNIYLTRPQSVQLSIENQRKIEDYDIKVNNFINPVTTLFCNCFGPMISLLNIIRTSLTKSGTNFGPIQKFNILV